VRGGVAARNFFAFDRDRSGLRMEFCHTGVLAREFGLSDVQVTRVFGCKRLQVRRK
jgi:hypothetical protein